MSNEILWLIFALVNFSMIVIAYKLFGKTGLFAWIAMGTILANIQVTKTIDFNFFGIHLVATLGNIMYGTLFLVTDSLGEKYGLKDIKSLLQWGASPRASLYLTIAAKSNAFLRHRGYVTPEDVRIIGIDVLRHRIILSYEAEAEDISSDDIVRKIFDTIEVP